MIVFLLINGHHVLLKAVQKSFLVVPLGGVHFGGNIAAKFIVLTGDLFYLGVQIASPIMLALFIVQVALGLLSRVAPQMNVFMLSFPLNILIGVLLVWLGLPIFYIALNKLFYKNNQDLLGILLMMGRR